MHLKLPRGGCIHLKKIILFFPVLLIGVGTGSVSGQTTLSPGDLMVVTVNADTPDSFAFVPLVDLEPGTVIHFTDNAFIATGDSLHDEGEGVYSYTTPSAVTAGSVIFFSGSEEDGFEKQSGNFDPSVSGDNIIFYQTSTDTTYLYGVGWARGETVWQYAEGSTSNNRSDIPPGLNEADNTILSLGTDQNLQYQSGNGVEGTPDQLLELTGDETNWAGNNSTPYPPPGSGFTINPLPSVKFATTSHAVSENGGEIGLIVELAEANNTAVSVEVGFQASASSATSSDLNDFVSEVVSFASTDAGGTQKEISINVSDDSEYEGDETAVFTLQNLSEGTAIAPSSIQVEILDDDKPGVVINEILADPSGNGLDGDANKDANNSTSEDEFVEILNTEAVSVDISGWTLSDNVGERFTFPEETILPARSAAVVFGGGAPAGSFGGSHVFTSSLGLNNSGDSIVLSDSSGLAIDSHNYGSEGGDNQSLVRNPDGTGTFVKHSSVAGSGGALFSPGTKTGGINFDYSVTIEGTAGWRMLSAPVANMEIGDITAKTPIQGYGDGFPKNFYNHYNGTEFVSEGLSAPIENKVLNPGKGYILYFYNNSNAGSSALPVTLEANSGTEHTGDVTGVPLHSDGDRWNLLGNPFESAIDISNIDNWVSGGSEGLASSVGQIWDNESNSYILTSSNNDKVEAWQGFFIENSDATEISFPASAKTTGSRFYREGDSEGYLALTLNGEYSEDNVTTTDKAAVLYFHDNATHGWDDYDASKLLPLTGRYALIGFRSERQDENGMELKAQDSRPFDFEGEISYYLQLSINDMQGAFELTWRKESLPDSWNFTLVDNETGSQINMNNNSSYSFDFIPIQKAADSGVEENEAERSLPVATVARVNPEQEPRFVINVSSGNRSESDVAPSSVKLNPNYPNPFNPTTNISFELTESAPVQLNVYTIVGQRVATLVDEVREAGQYTETWNAADMPSGIYIAQLEVGGKVYIRKMTLIK